MCGFAGILGWETDEATWQTTLQEMSAALRHRGPDSTGHWISQNSSIGMTHQRLAIVDLSATGHQPMISASGRHIIAFNGEIYNFEELKADLEQGGHRFRSRSDTEVLLEGIEKWGLKSALSRCHGMFAFSLFDRKNQELILARDRFGEKPLYWGISDNKFLFSSELRALKKVPGFRRELSETGLSLYKVLGHYPGKHSVYKNIFKLEPGTFLTVEKKNLHTPIISNYYDLSAIISERKLIEISLEDAAEEYEKRLTKIIQRQLVADVPVGCFLSSGIDSSLISALAQKTHSSKINTFSAGFENSVFDESAQAKQIAATLGTEHHELRVSSQSALDLVPRLGQLYDEPFADSSQIPTLLLSQLVKKHVTVALSGDAGDEAMAGYNRYIFLNKYWPPNLALKGAGALLKSKIFQKLLAQLVNSRKLESLQKFSDVISAQSLEDAYRILTQFEPSKAVELIPAPSSLDPVETAIFWDQRHYLPNDILVKVDRAAMAYSLETRIPFLDHSLIEWSWQLPLAYKIEGGTTKILSRRLLKKYFPEEIFNQPKKGFAVPLHQWMRGSLVDLISAHFRSPSEALIDRRELLQLWESYRNGNDRLRDLLWAIFVFELWHKEV